MGLNELWGELRQKYTSCILRTSQAERQFCRERFRADDSVLKLLAACKLSDRLHRAIVQVMDELKEDWQPEEVALAFDALETYAINLLEYPWKKEFHTILLYSGFYKTRLEPNLQEPHLLLGIIGYEHVPDERLHLVNGVPSRAVLTDAAVNFFLAATECRVISLIISKVEHSTPVEVYWMRRANASDEQTCIDTINLSRQPLPPDSEKPRTFEGEEIDKYPTKFNANVEKRGDSPYDNVLTTTDDIKPEYGLLTQPSPSRSSEIRFSRTDDIEVESKLPKPLIPAFSTTFRHPNVMGQVVKSPPSQAGSVFQHRTPEAPPPVYSAAKDMPSAQLQNISYSQDSDVDGLAALLRNVDPHVMENAAHRQRIMTQLENYSSSSSGSAKPELSPKCVGQQMHADATSNVSVGWQCQKCTYYNENTGPFCDMCHSEKV